MKFAKRLEEEAIPEWRLKYVNYDVLKTLIEKIPQPPIVVEKEPAVVSTFVNRSSPSRRDAEMENIRRSPFNIEEQIFLDRIKQELAVVDDFYQLRESEAIDRKFKLMAQVQILPKKANNTSKSYSDDEFENEPNELVLSARNEISVTGFSASNTSSSHDLLSSHTNTQKFPEQAKIRTIRGASFSKLARSRIKKALLEYYRSLELLKTYRTLNYQAFIKILKKFDKRTGRKISLEYLEEIKKHPFYSSPALDSLIKDVEDIYQYVFTNGDRTKALRKLRLIDLKQETFYGCAVLSGLFLGSSAAMIFYILKHVVVSPLGSPVQHTLFYIYAAFFLPLLMGCLFAVNMVVWDRNFINYRFIFEYNQRNMLHSMQYLALCSGLMTIYLVFALASLYGVFNSIIRPFLQPWIPLCFLFAFFIIPFPILFPSTRLWFTKVNFRIIMGPFYPVRFKDFFLNDQYMSLGTTFQAFGWLIQLAGMKEDHATYFVSFRPTFYIFLIALLPATGRIFQCIRRYKDTRMWFPHLANMAKYFFSFGVVLLPILPHKFPNFLKIMITATASIFSLVWDVVMDFGFFQKGSMYPFLRANLLFKTPLVYYSLILADFVARFLWLSREIIPRVAPKFLASSVNSGGLPPIALGIILAFIEVFRRIMWNFFRVEYEQINNCNCFKAVNDVALPYLNTGDLFYHDMAKELASKETSASENALNDESTAYDCPSLKVGATLQESASFSETNTINEDVKVSNIDTSVIIEMQSMPNSINNKSSRNAIAPSDIKNSGWNSGRLSSSDRKSSNGM